MMLANDGAEADVPLTKYTENSPWLFGTQDPSRHSRYGSCDAAVSETSGRSRTPSTGIPSTPYCQLRLATPGVVPPDPMFPALAPPLPAQSPSVGLLSFHTFSGM